ncbi:MAG: winged helix-turn-helix transcriptional regulator [Candidatus Diapherotrites archaeon]|nr:winged helix-turn-helix transcriptional regulator [Candidatus Diapherotrites archaeon]
MNADLFGLHAELCKTLADPKRLEILSLLSEGEKTVSELEGLMKIRQANLSQHLAVLRQRNVVVARKHGTTVSYKVANRKMIKACNLIRAVLLEQLEDTGRILRAATR